MSIFIWSLMNRAVQHIYVPKLIQIPTLKCGNGSDKEHEERDKRVTACGRLKNV